MDILEFFEEEIIFRVEIPIVLEFGACDGYHSNELLKRIKSVDRPFGYIFHCFEPKKDLHQQIINNLHGHLMFNNGVIGIFPDAIGEENGQATFYESSGQKIEKGHVLDNYYGSSSLRKPKPEMVKSFPGMQFNEGTIVNVTTLDTHAERTNLTGGLIDFIWADIQGNENALIKGGLQTFKNVRYFYTEYSKDGSEYEGQATFKELLAMLPDFTVVEDYGGDVLLKNKNW